MSHQTIGRYVVGRRVGVEATFFGELDEGDGDDELRILSRVAITYLTNRRATLCSKRSSTATSEAAARPPLHRQGYQRCLGTAGTVTPDRHVNRAAEKC